MRMNRQCRTMQGLLKNKVSSRNALLLHKLQVLRKVETCVLSGAVGQLGNSSNTSPGPPGRPTSFQRSELGPNGLSASPARVRGNTHPPLGWFIGNVLCTSLAFYCLIKNGFSGSGMLHLLGAITGMIVGLVLMGLFRQAINLRMSSGTFADWPISSVKLGTSLSVAGWLFGLANLVIFAIEISRNL